jgi:hypothetical protein
MRLRTVNLDRLYRKLNTAHFEGKLPSIPVLWMPEVPVLWKRTVNGTVASLHAHGYLPCPGGKRNCRGPYIVVNPQFEDCPALIEFFLLHEMNHARGFIDGEQAYFSHEGLWQEAQLEFAIKGVFNDLW